MYLRIYSDSYDKERLRSTTSLTDRTLQRRSCLKCDVEKDVIKEDNF